ncbi:hypothetical protein PHLGIDRAFT_35952 [Phlebiopsis gigantea 11061_1 CR5-6]|uniref:Uncharacterized protein n=1 Tax=Phlebiopsis gigantea (strain 11061_1 CR5-6) TaxID=745531 RepID=A0A0C3S9S3_PHLG1|nr:hypothetical protein PHLGIDRAFT_35952 [Phlebiopsis gigantea 11061_1 CR5-6]
MIYPSPYASSSPQHNWLSVPYATAYGRDGYYSSPSSVSSSPMSSQFSASLSAYSTPVSEHQSLPPRCAELPLVGSRPLGFGPFGLFGPLDFGHAANNAVYDGLALGDAWAPGPSGSLQLDLQGAPPGQGEATAALTGGNVAFSMQMYETPVVGFSTDASSLT